MMGSFFPNSPTSMVTPRVSTSGAPGRARIEPPRILIVDDEESILALLKTILAKAGYSVYTAASGADAEKVCREAMLSGSPFDCAILDYDMQEEASGSEIFAKLKEIDTELRGIVSSGDPSREVCTNYRKFGFEAVIHKPYSNADLIAAIAALGKSARNADAGGKSA